MDSSTRLLIIDDDHELCELLTDYLSAAEFQVDSVGTGTEGIQRAITGRYAAAILDVMLPDLDGFEVLKRIRAQSTLPILMLTARGEDVDRIVGLEIGADDYLPKPFNTRELIARLRAILRRTQTDARAPQVTPQSTIVVEDLQLDPASRTVEWSGQSIDLTSAEFDLLEALLRSAGRVVSREELSNTVFGRALQPEDRSIDVHISNLRRKLAQRGGGVTRIKTLRGTGYIYALSARSPAESNSNDSSASRT